MVTAAVVLALSGWGQGWRPALQSARPPRVTCPQCPQCWRGKVWSKVTFRFQNIQWVSALGRRAVLRQLELQEDELILTQHI